MAVYTVKLKRQPKEGETINIVNGFKFSKSPTILPPAFDRGTNRYLTGIDDLDTELSKLSKSEKEKEKERRLELRSQLEEQTGYNLIATNEDFWSNAVAELYEGRIFDTSVPKDRIAIEFLKRRGDVAFGRDNIWNPKTLDIEFYVETGEQTKSFDSGLRRKSIRATAKLAEILDNKEVLFNVAYILNLAPKREETAEEIEGKLTKFFEVDEDNMDKFINACNIDKEKLQNIILLKKAYKAKVINFDVETKVFYRGGFTYKNTIEDSVDYLMLPENLSEIAEIAKLVAKKEKGATIYA